MIRLGEVLLLWLAPAAAGVLAYAAFKDWETTAQYTNAGAFLILATAWLLNWRTIKAAIPGKRGRAWGWAAAFCVTTWVAGILFFLRLHAEWAGLWVLILSMLVMVTASPEDTPGKAKGIPSPAAPGPPAEPPIIAEVKRSRRRRTMRAMGCTLLTAVVLGAGAVLLCGPKGLLTWQVCRAWCGSGNANLAVGWRYREGDGVPQNFSRAAQWFERATRQGSAKAAYDLGVLCYYGLGMPADADRAQNWLEVAVRREYAPALTLLGLIAQNEHHDPERALTLWNQAAAHDDAWAEYLLGSAYLVKREEDGNNLVLALYWLEQARRDGVEPIKGMIEHVWATVPEDELEQVTDAVYQRLDGAPEAPG
ncbi:MAG: tetratricopeptide repeat protein [Opitutaceae bacterium]|nr:tetratricopeptide repeat protein [Opitutaceae bacterium]